MTDAEFHDLVDRARQGDAEAMERLLDAFADDVRAMVRGRLPRSLRPRFDSVDFVQDIMLALCEKEFGEGAGYESAARFRAYLSGAVRNRVLEEYRRRTRCQKNDLAREEPLYVERSGRAEPRAVAAHDATASEELHARECLDRLVAGGSEIEARIVELRRQALTYDEIAARLGIHERTVRRLVDAMRARWPGGGAAR